MDWLNIMRVRLQILQTDSELVNVKIAPQWFFITEVLSK